MSLAPAIERRGGPLLGSSAANRFPGDYRELTGVRGLGTTFTRTATHESVPPASRALIAQIVKLQGHALSAPTVEEYRRRASESLLDFYALSTSYIIMCGTEATTPDDTERLFARIEAWGTRRRVDQLAHGLSVAQRATSLIARLVSEGRLGGERLAEEDLTTARQWALAQAGFAWSVLAALQIIDSPTILPGIFDAVYEDIVESARSAYVAARTAFERHRPSQDD